MLFTARNRHTELINRISRQVLCNDTMNMEDAECSLAKTKRSLEGEEIEHSKLPQNIR
jgi:hypothetical protein